MRFLMLKDHKSAMHLEGVTFDKVICNSNETEKSLIFFTILQLSVGNNAPHTFLRQYVSVF